MNIAIIAVTKQGEEIASLIGKSFACTFYSKETVKEQGIRNITEASFKNNKAIIFISSTGIAVRTIAPFLKSKTTDPAVIVIDNSMNYVISLLSGHLGGANELTNELSKILGAKAIITTATDNLGIVPPDIIAKSNELTIDSMKTCKDIAAILVNGGKVAFKDEANIIKIPRGYEEYIFTNTYNGMVLVGNKKSYYEGEGIPTLKLIRKNIVLGIGCKKNYSFHKMRDFVRAKLEELNIDYRSVCNIGTVEVKKHEEAIINLSKDLDCLLRIFTIEDIRCVHHRYKGSDFVEKTIGVRAVSEPCTELMGAKLITERLTHEGMTLCIGEIVMREEK